MPVKQPTAPGGAVAGARGGGVLSRQRCAGGAPEQRAASPSAVSLSPWARKRSDGVHPGHPR